MKQSLKTKLKQLWFPKAFRLPEPEFSKDQIDLLEELIQLIHPTLSKVENATRDERVHMARFLVDLGTGIWRIRRKIEGLTRMPKEIRDALYSLESTWMSMSEGGVEIVDHIGTIPGKNEAKVVEVRDIPNLVREQVVDAVKPTILLRGEVIQLGEVIMGRPLKNGAAAKQPAPVEQMEPRDLEEPLVEAAAMEPREEEDAPPSETYQVETLSLEPQPETASEEAPETPAANDIDTNITDAADTSQDEMSAEAWPETPIDDTEEPVIPPPVIIEENPQIADDETAELPVEPATELPQFDEDGEVVPPPAEPLIEMIEEAAAEEIAAEPEPTPEEKIEAIESAQPAVALPADDIDALDVPDVPPAPKAKRKTTAKTGAKAKTAKKTAKKEATKTEDDVPKDGESETETPPARKPARPKRKRPAPAEEPVKTEVEVDG